MSSTAPLESAPPAFDLDEIVVLAAVNGSGTKPGRIDVLRRAPLPVTGADRSRIEATCRRLLAQCALLPAPRSPCGYAVSLIGLARLYRFVQSPLGSAGVTVDADCAARRVVLDSLPAEEREGIEERISAALIERRAGVFRCIHADLCAGKGCPFTADVDIEAIDRGMMALTGRRPDYLQ